jgi:C-terminal processing protease CtpA/Prc
LEANAWVIEMLRSAQAPQEALSARARTLQWMDNAKSGKYPSLSDYEFPQPDLRYKDVFREPLYILIDRECASSCELLLQNLEALPHRILVGENTMGAVTYGEIGQVVLPESRMIVTLATTSTSFRDQRRPEKQGYAPDIAVAPGDDALAEALTLVH